MVYKRRICVGCGLGGVRYAYVLQEGRLKENESEGGRYERGVFEEKGDIQLLVYERVTHLKMFEGVDIIIRLMQLGDGKGGETKSLDVPLFMIGQLKENDTEHVDGNEKNW